MQSQACSDCVVSLLLQALAECGRQVPMREAMSAMQRLIPREHLSAIHAQMDSPSALSVRDNADKSPINAIHSRQPTGCQPLSSEMHSQMPHPTQPCLPDQTGEISDRARMGDDGPSALSPFELVGAQTGVRALPPRTQVLIPACIS